MTTVVDSARTIEAYVAADFIDLFLGEEIGYGQYRRAYLCHTNKNWVIKVARDAEGIYHNMHEWHTWSNMPEHMQKYYAPVRWLSPKGNVIIQERVDPCPQLPEMTITLPDINDLKRTNIGLLEGRYVVFDIGLGYCRGEKTLKVRDFVFPAGENWPDYDRSSAARVEEAPDDVALLKEGAKAEEQAATWKGQQAQPTNKEGAPPQAPEPSETKE